ncbi:hypothetical protein, partial [Clostridium perfringens]|uniref:hypothetical protein n=2 Tax=Bacillota TaxID=1239 RepID=UPI001A9ABE14
TVKVNSLSSSEIPPSVKNRASIHFHVPIIESPSTATSQGLLSEFRTFGASLKTFSFSIIRNHLLLLVIITEHN